MKCSSTWPCHWLAMMFIYRGSWLQVVLCLIGIYALYQLVGWEHSLKKHFLAELPRRHRSRVLDSPPAFAGLEQDPSGGHYCLAGIGHCIYGIRPRLQPGTVAAAFRCFS